MLTILFRCILTTDTHARLLNFIIVSSRILLIFTFSWYRLSTYTLSLLGLGPNCNLLLATVSCYFRAIEHMLILVWLNLILARQCGFPIYSSIESVLLWGGSCQSIVWLHSTASSLSSPWLFQLATEGHSLFPLNRARCFPSSYPQFFLHALLHHWLTICRFECQILDGFTFNELIRVDIHLDLWLASYGRLCGRGGCKRLLVYDPVFINIIDSLMPLEKHVLLPGWADTLRLLPTLCLVL